MAQPQAAVVILEHLTRLCPDHINYLHQLAGIRLQLNLPQQALDACQKALKLDPENPDSLFNTGVVLSALKAHDAACDCYAKALQFNSRHYGALRNFPLELSRLGLNDQAQEASARACTLYADDAWMHFNAGELLLGLRKPDEAVNAYRRCIELAPHHAEAQYGLAIALAASGQI
ncbi:MAG: tetratricopeptide repeat protein, partial [Rhodocyclaceae bacterium]|nr:tetratricopeptide repeat protein [Rhodocyclaceae bacterium]